MIMCECSLSVTCLLVLPLTLLFSLRDPPVGSSVMIFGTTIQITAFGPHKGFLQFMIGRIICVSLRRPLFSFPARASLTFFPLSSLPARSLQGLGNGANTSTIPSWVAESTKSHNRGFLVCVEASMVAVGTLIS